MFDTLHLEIPKGSGYRRTFLNALDKLTPETERKAINNQGREYSKRIDLRYLDIPALLHVTNLRNKKGGDKIEFIGAGGLGVGQMAGYIHEVYKTDVDECSIMRLDATADIDGAWVDWARRNVRVMGKQCYQEETPGNRTETFRGFSRNAAETIYWGRGSRQTIVYDKTGERRYQLQKKTGATLRKQKDNLPLGGGPTQHGMKLAQMFEQEYGYPITEDVTRFERRCGAREFGKVFDIPKFGNIQKAAFIDPFDQMQFPEQTLDRFVEKELRGVEILALYHLKDYHAIHGWAFTRNHVFKKFKSRVTAYRFLNKIEAYLMPTGTGPTREQVRKAYVASTLIQLAA
jgi:hypothetical protein